MATKALIVFLAGNYCGGDNLRSAKVYVSGNKNNAKRWKVPLPIFDLSLKVKSKFFAGLSYIKISGNRHVSRCTRTSLNYGSIKSHFVTKMHLAQPTFTTDQFQKIYIRVTVTNDLTEEYTLLPHCYYGNGRPTFTYNRDDNDGSLLFGN